MGVARNFETSDMPIRQLFRVPLIVEDEAQKIAQENSPQAAEEAEAARGEQVDEQQPDPEPDEGI